MECISQFVGKYRFLSNYYPCPITHEGIQYDTVEHAYQASKTNDLFIKEFIRSLPRPNDTRTYTNTVGFQYRSDWETYKFEVMLALLKQKFSYPDFAFPLLSTGDAILVEGNYWHDNVWGVCSCCRCFGRINGRNQLGIYLTRLRAVLRERHNGTPNYAITTGV